MPNFDCVIMNPPYADLHTKIMNKCISAVKDKGKVINLSPIRWIDGYYPDRCVAIKKNSRILNSLVDLDPITLKEGMEYFDADTTMRLGIYTLVRRSETHIDISDLRDPMVERVVQFMDYNPAPFEENQYLGWRVRMPIISNMKDLLYLNFKYKYFYNGMRDGKPWYDFYLHNSCSKYTKEITNSILFDTEMECVNFISSFETPFVKYISAMVREDVHIYSNMILYMGKQINPRTKEKGYRTQWTNADFYEFFNLTQEERQRVEDTINRKLPYKWS